MGLFKNKYSYSKDWRHGVDIRSNEGLLYERTWTPNTGIITVLSQALDSEGNLDKVHYRDGGWMKRGERENRREGQLMRGHKAR